MIRSGSPRRFGRGDVLADVADVVGVIVRVDDCRDRLVGHRRDSLGDVVVDALKRVEDQHTVVADVEDRAVVEGLHPPGPLRQPLQHVRLGHVALEQVADLAPGLEHLGRGRLDVGGSDGGWGLDWYGNLPWAARYGRRYAARHARVNGRFGASAGDGVGTVAVHRQWRGSATTGVEPMISKRAA